MTDVVPVNHDGGDRHACLFADFNSVQGLDERGYVALCERLHSLNHQLSSPGGRAWICLQIQPCGACVPAAVRIMSHIGRAAKAAYSTCCHCGCVCVAIHLQCRSNEAIHGVLPGKLAKYAI